MKETFSRKREFDFVRYEGLQRATGRPAHEWDLYLVKELLDNALDADERLWKKDPECYPRIEVRMESLFIPVWKSHQLTVTVTNRAPFPLDQITQIFDPTCYTSRKACLKGLARGALGNALKTLLGIPYALHYRSAQGKSWSPVQIPMSLQSNRRKVFPSYNIDPAKQSIRFEITKETPCCIDGTKFQIILDSFPQENPRTVEQMKQFALRYHLCNPHAEFHWLVTLDDKKWEQGFPRTPGWKDKFLGLAPISWYSAAAFQDLWNAITQKQNGHEHVPEALFRCFPEDAHGVIRKTFEKTGFSFTKIDPLTLYENLFQQCAPLESSSLGAIGEIHIGRVLGQAFQLDGEGLFYERATDSGDDSERSFVIEAALARMKNGQRQIWTALNFSPTYIDPFCRRWLYSVTSPDKPALGLRGLLDASGISEESLMIFFLHIVCPTLEHHEFSKTEINHLPFRDVLSRVVEKLVSRFRQAQEEVELRLEEKMGQALKEILAELHMGERPILDQLLVKLRQRLCRDPALAGWIETAEAESRMRICIGSYLNSESQSSQKIARHATPMISLPSHPKYYYSLPIENWSHSKEQHINKILYVPDRKLEAMVLGNAWLCRLDTALLHNPAASEELFPALFCCLRKCDLPLVILYDTDTLAQVNEICCWLKEEKWDDRLIKVEQDSRLIDLMPEELLLRMLNHFKNIDFPVKALPTAVAMREEIRSQFDSHLGAYLWEQLSQTLQVPRLVKTLNDDLQISCEMQTQTLDAQISARLEEDDFCKHSYSMALRGIVGEFFSEILEQKRRKLQTLIQDHLKNSTRRTDHD